MSLTRHPLTLRPNSSDYTLLLWAIGVSLLVHSSGYGIYKIGDHYGLWNKLHTPQWIQRLVKSLVPPRVDPKQLPPEREAPLMFVEVNPAYAVAEPPKNAKYYAAQSTKASNPDADKETNVPKIAGTQDKVMRTEDTPRMNPTPLQPAPPEPKLTPAEPEKKPNPVQERGDLTLAKVEPEAKPRPRTIAEALARQPNPRLTTAGKMAKQDGGVRQRNIASSLDAIGSPFGAYDAAIVAAIQDRWFGLLEERRYASDRAGKVVLHFRLNYDGRVTDMVVAENTVDELLCLLCQKAVLDPAPFARWPSDMRLKNGADYRDVQFTFYYN